MIDKNVPMPERAKRGPTNEYYKLFSSMEVGDSFLFPMKSTYRNAVVCISRAKGTYAPNIKLSYKQEDNNIRVWRRA